MWKSDSLSSSADFGFWPFGHEFDQMTDYEVGKHILSLIPPIYNKKNAKQITVEQFLSNYTQAQIEGLGFGVKSVPEITTSLAKSAFEDMVANTYGLVPKNLSPILDYLSQTVQGVTPVLNMEMWKDFAVNFVLTPIEASKWTVNTAVDLIQTTTGTTKSLIESTGETAKGITKNITWLLPMGLVVAGLGIVAYIYTIKNKVK